MDEAFQRARRPEQKEQRREHLLATARELLVGGFAPAELSLSELARRAGMAKANVYRYFESREALLLAVLVQEWTRWFAGFAARRGAKARPTLAALTASLARSLGGEELLCALTAALPSVIEQNVSEQTVRAFKRETRAFFFALAGELRKRCPALSEAGWAALVRDGAHAIMGLYPATHPAPAVARALAEPELRFFARDFGDDLERFLCALAADHARRERAKRGSERERAKERGRSTARTQK